MAVGLRLEHLRSLDGGAESSKRVPVVVDPIHVLGWNGLSFGETGGCWGSSPADFDLFGLSEGTQNFTQAAIVRTKTDQSRSCRNLVVVSAVFLSPVVEPALVGGSMAKLQSPGR